MKNTTTKQKPGKEDTSMIASGCLIIVGIIASVFLLLAGHVFTCVLMWAVIMAICINIGDNGEVKSMPTKRTNNSNRRLSDKDIEAVVKHFRESEQRELEKLEKQKKILEEKLHPKVKREEYDLLLSETDKLVRFIKDISKREEVKEAVNKVLTIKDENTDELIDYNDRIMYAIFADVKKGYEGMGHVFPSDDPEQIGILMFSYIYISKDDNPASVIDYSSYGLLTDSITPDSIKFIWDIGEKINTLFHEKSNMYVIHYILTLCNEDYAIQYITLLYRFLSTTAKADGTINEQEEQWLVNIANKYLQKPSPEKDSVQQKGSSPTSNTESNKSAEEELNELIGLSSVKEDVMRLTNFVRIQQERLQRGMKAASVSYHCVFTGNPGTGKTTVARIVARLYKDLGILKKGQLIETDRSGLVAEYVGQTAVKTNKIVDSALDGILFIDEAYSLVQGSKQDYGNEAVATLLKRMEDNRDRLVVILAGYENEMKQFIDSNPGLQSRFNRYIHFSDYSANELMQIFKKNVEKLEYKLTQSAEEKLQDYLSQAVANKDQNFGNARFVRNLFEKTLENQATRLASVTKLTTETLSEITEKDIPMA